MAKKNSGSWIGKPPEEKNEKVSPVAEASEAEVPLEVPGHQDASEDVPGKYLKLKGMK